MGFKIIEATREDRKKNYKKFRDKFAQENNFEIMSAKDISNYVNSDQFRVDRLAVVKLEDKNLSDPVVD